MIFHSRCLVINAVVLGPLFFPVAAIAAQINGSVQTATGTAVPQAIVVINIRATTSTTQPFSAVVRTATDGTFSATGLPAGTFAVCPEAPNTALLAPCTWESEFTATVTANQTLSLAPLQMTAGVHLPIRVNDPTGVRASSEGSVPGASLSIDVTTPRGFRIPTTVTSRDSTGQNHDVVVPFATAVQLNVSSTFFAVANSAGAAVGLVAGAQLPVISVPIGTTPSQVVFTVTGKN